MKRGLVIIAFLAVTLLVAACSSPGQPVMPPGAEQPTEIPSAPAAQPMQKNVVEPKKQPTIPSDGPSIDGNLPSKTAYEQEEGPCEDVVSFHEKKLSDLKEDLSDSQVDLKDAQATGDTKRVQYENKQMDTLNKKITVEDKILAKAHKICGI